MKLSAGTIEYNIPKPIIFRSCCRGKCPVASFWIPLCLASHSCRCVSPEIAAERKPSVVVSHKDASTRFHLEINLYCLKQLRYAIKTVPLQCFFILKIPGRGKVASHFDFLIINANYVKTGSLSIVHNVSFVSS